MDISPGINVEIPAANERLILKLVAPPLNSPIHNGGPFSDWPIDFPDPVILLQLQPSRPDLHFEP